VGDTARSRLGRNGCAERSSPRSS